jgi:putative ATPase
VLESLSEEALGTIIERAGAKLSEDAFEWLMGYANGDARKALGMLEGAIALYGKKITVANLNKALESPHLRYDKKGDEHYDTISAFIKSMRASQPDAAMYYLARMIEAGEDPLFIARRMVIFASEDIGLAQPTALVVANAVFRACETIGYPECSLNLAHGVAYLANAAKDRSANDALAAAQADVKAFGNLKVPMNIRNAPTKLMKNLGYGKGYKKYDDESYLPEKIQKHSYFPKRKGKAKE